MRRTLFPVFLIPIVGLLVGPAYAQMVGPAQAVRLLAKAKAADGKCRLLSDAEHEELSSYVARAEVAAVYHMPVEEAQATVRAGTAEGERAGCSPAVSEEVHGTLVAARSAIAQAQEVEGRKVAIHRSRREAPPDLGREPRPAPVSRRAAGSGDLRYYGERAMAYYVELKCSHLSRSDARSFWSAIVAAHKAALAANGTSAVAATLKQAKARADGLSCNRHSAELVRTAFAAVRD